jgi:hypothetical protein
MKRSCSETPMTEPTTLQRVSSESAMAPRVLSPKIGRNPKKTPMEVPPATECGASLASRSSWNFRTKSRM